MDSDTIREKYIRSEEALTRIKDDISQLISSRLQDFKTTKDYLETLIKEKEAVDTQITEQEAKISSMKELIATNKKLIESTKQKQVDVIQDEQTKETQFRDIEREQQNVIRTKESLKKEINKIKLDLDNTKIAITDYQQKIHTLETQLSQDIETKEQELTILRRDFSQIQANNSILSFLLNESAEDIPEVDILAELMNKGRVSQDQLKQSLEEQISPVIITRTLGRMIEKGLIKYYDNDNTYSTN